MLPEIGREARLVGVSRLIWGLGDGMVVLILPIYLTSLGVEASSVGAIFGVGVAVSALLVLPASALADRIGRKPVMLLSVLAAMVGLLIFLTPPTGSAAYVAAAIYWVVVAILPLMNAHVASSQSPQTLGRAMGFSYGVSMVGTVVAPPVASAIAFLFGLSAPLLLAIAAYACLAATTLLLRPTNKGVRASTPLGPGQISRLYWALLLLLLLAVAVCSLPILLLPVYLQSVAAVPLQTIGLYIALTSVGGALISALAGYCTDRAGPGATLIAVAVILALGAIATAAGIYTLLPLGLFLLGAQMGANPILASLIRRVLPLEHISTGYATLQLVTRLGVAAAGVAAGILYESDPRLPLLACGVLALPVAAIVAMCGSSISARVRTEPGIAQTPGGTARHPVAVQEVDRDQAAAQPRTTQ